MKTLAFTGHRPQHLAGCEDRVQAALHRLVQDAAKHHYTDFYSGMAAGVDMWAAKAVVAQQLRLHAAVPFPHQDGRWPMPTRHEWVGLLRKAAKLYVVSEGREFEVEEFFQTRQDMPSLGYGEICGWLEKRNRFMVDNAHALLAVWDGKESGGTYNCIRYALRVGRKVIHYHPHTERTTILE